MVKKFIIKGLVQGIGYRPFVAKIADELNIAGWVRNTGGIVTVMACGSEEDLKSFHRKLSFDVPTGGFVTDIRIENVDNSDEFRLSEKGTGFVILESDEDVQENLPLIPADIATCDTCKSELLDPANRRYMHPFISCTICGPRYSIIEKLPYDRDTITMADFEMCDDCRAEYTGKKDRRRHAQTIACKDCGPSLKFVRLKYKITDNVTECGNVDNIVDIYNENDIVSEISRSSQLIKSGGILAIKDIGGYHLACDPFNEKAVAALRILKHREAKAFAVMFEDVDKVREFCNVDNFEADLLESPARPIVLVRRREDVSFPQNVCLTSPDIGAMLPCNPVQIMLVHECGSLIMTSGNASRDVLEIDNDRMTAWLQERVNSGELPEDVPVGILSHNRRILRPMDDSVMKVVRGRKQFIRRGRGHVPNPIPVDISGEIFAAGGDLKSSFCYVKDGLAYVSQYLGDLEAVSCQQFYKNEMTGMEQIFGFKPEAVVCDLHPGYFSRKMAAQLAEDRALPISYVQHHKAHVAAVIAEHHLQGQVLGFAFDGTGYGEDGTVWGSEVFIWDGKGNMERVAHMKPVKLIGGNEGAKNCDTILTGMLHAAVQDDKDTNPNAKLIAAAIDNNINTVVSTSMGRWFDAMSAHLDICHYNSYEGQAPIELENIVYTNSDKGIIAREFIYSVADFILTQAKKYQIKQVVLSGGTFLNRILLERTIDILEAEGFQVYISEQLPPGDGSICLGQAYLAHFNILHHKLRTPS
ncbi:carbamoyltransferase HypF [Pseudobutyrivibrio xylanivorans]|uniref:Carbamoyltransferase n=1 Tax=Pseudobutyrivibrio xylanivorans TaxID=185007 RepID=A0A5P6VU38_PSEXY|nr:carbamoyltransferase HypF [Pseudobutyrivibrio xylanivorans]QFJ56107.1 carbamoyltransferase HypF [Pseudobutyrivibrio xylanivorans]